MIYKVDNKELFGCSAPPDVIRALLSEPFPVFPLPALELMTWDNGHGNERILKISSLSGTLEVIQSTQKGLKERKKKGCQFPRNNKESYVCELGRRQGGVGELNIQVFISFVFP